MTRLTNNRCAFTGALALGFSVVAAPQAGADHVGNYAGPTTYSLKLTHMPDFDQRRQAGMGQLGLPGDGGMYCVPTSTMNLMAYAANHGFPALAPGPAWWQSQALYNDATTNIDLMGALMGTSASNGTNGAGQSFGAAIWLAAYGGQLTRSTILASGNSCPTITHIAQSVATGGITSLCYGRYVYLGNIGGVDFVGARTGGHCVTFSEATRSGSNIVIKVRDPADDPDWAESGAHLFSQSMFADKVFTNVSQRTVNNFNWQRTMTSIIYPPPVPDEGTWLIRLIDSYQVIRPKSGYSWQPGINNDPPIFIFVFPPMGGFTIPGGISVELASFFDVSDVALSPDLVNAYVLGTTPAGAQSLQRVELPTGIATEIAPVPGAQGMTVGRKHEIYVLTSEGVLCINSFNDEKPVEAQIVPPAPVVALCYHDERDHVMVFSPDAQKIFAYKHRFENGAKPVEVTCIPPSVPLEPDEGAIAINPVDGKAWFCTPASNTIYHVPFDPACDPMVEFMSMPEIVNPRCLSFDDLGHAFVKCDAGLVEAFYNEDTERWEAVDDPYFDDMPVGPRFYVTCSRTNYDPDEHSTPEWFNVDPDLERELEGAHVEVDCLADFVASDTFQPPPDGRVDGADLAFLLGEWGTAPTDGSLADIVTTATFAPPEDGNVDGADLAFLLGAWGECP